MKDKVYIMALSVSLIVIIFGSFALGVICEALWTEYEIEASKLLIWYSGIISAIIWIIVGIGGVIICLKERKRE